MLYVLHDMDLLNIYGLDLRVNGLTHRLGGLLDGVATRSDLAPHTVEISFHFILFVYSIRRTYATGKR